MAYPIYSPRPPFGPPSWSYMVRARGKPANPSSHPSFPPLTPTQSPRWLVSKGRDAQALKVLAYYHANGKQDDPLVEYEFSEIKTAIELDREVSANVGWLSLVKTPGNRRRMRIIVALAFFSQWSGNGLV